MPVSVKTLAFHLVLPGLYIKKVNLTQTHINALLSDGGERWLC